MSDIQNPSSNINPPTPSPDSSITNTLISIDLLVRQNSDITSRLAKLESQQKPLTSFLRASRRVSLIASVVLIGMPIMLIITVLLYFIILNPLSSTSNTIITIFSCLGLAALAEIVSVPIIINNVNNKVNRIIEKHYPSEDI